MDKANVLFGFFNSSRLMIISPSFLGFSNGGGFLDWPSFPFRLVLRAPLGLRATTMHTSGLMGDLVLVLFSKLDPFRWWLCCLLSRSLSLMTLVVARDSWLSLIIMVLVFTGSNSSGDQNAEAGDQDHDRHDQQDGEGDNQNQTRNLRDPSFQLIRRRHHRRRWHQSLFQVV